MDLSTIEVDPAEAQAKLAEYQGVIVSERMAEDEAIAAAYRAAARGLPLVRLPEVIGAGGSFDDGPSKGWPRIAIVRADATTCWCHKQNNWSSGAVTYVFSDADHRRNYGAIVGEHTVAVTLDQTLGQTQRYEVRTPVPVIPPNVRPRRPRLRRFHVLWEVEAWAHVPPRDPALLRHVRGDLWVVHATWELTDLERAVLGQRRP